MRNAAFLSSIFTNHTVSDSQNDKTLSNEAATSLH
jgi:hypothetical protein